MDITQLFARKLGFGAMRLPGSDKKNIDYPQLCDMVDMFLERGFNYFDTAFVYAGSEDALRNCLTSRHSRDSYLLTDKLPPWNRRSFADYQKAMETSLKRCGVDYFDIYLMHNMGKDRYAKTQAFGGFEFAERMKAEGKIKNFGFSFHDDAEMLDRILTEHPEVDFVQLQINYLDWNNNIIQSRKCYETAVSHNKPVIVMEPVKGGTLANLPPEADDLLKNFKPGASAASYALRFAASLDNVIMVLSGMNTMEQIIENTNIFDNFEPISEAEKQLLSKVVNIIEKCTEIPCTSCGYCMEVCPKNISIPQLFGLYNNYKINGNFSRMYHDRITYNRGKASDCLNCHRCEHNCPQHIAIPEHLKKIAGFEQ